MTGGLGLIGSETVLQLQNLYGARNVYSTDLGKRRTTSYTKDATYQSDVSKSSFSDLLTELSPTIIVHAAAHPGGRSLQEPSLNVETNALGSMRVFEWCAKNDCKILYLSSSIVYGDVLPVPITEDRLPNPGTIYGVSKLACEQWLKILEVGYDLDWSVIRPFSTYGFGHVPSLDQGIVNVMLTQIDSGGPVVVKGSLERQRDLVHVSDAARAICCAIERWSSRRIINVCTGISTSILEILHLIATERGIRFENLEIQEEVGTVGDPMYNVGDPRLARELIKFEAKTSVKEGIAQLISQRLRVRA